MVFTRFSGRTDSLTHSQTDRPDYRMPLAPFFNGDVGIKNQIIKGVVFMKHHETRAILAVHDIV